MLIANAIAALLQPSLYDSIILIKKLPYLPDLLPSSSGMYNVYVEDFMIKDVKFIWNNMSYHELKAVLKENRGLRSFPIVENPETMILLGSIQRLELIKIIEKHIGRERRLQVVARWQKEAQERAKEEYERKRKENERQRRPSRFEVVPAPDILRMKQQSSGTIDKDHGFRFHPVFGSQPKKSILKKTNSFNLRNYSPLNTPSVTPYTTVTGAESRIRMAFEAIFHKSTTLQDVEPSVEGDSPEPRGVSPPPPYQPVSLPASPGANKKVQLPRERVIDMSPEDQKEWEEEELRAGVTFDCHIDPSPFQLVGRTSLLKAHSIFSLVGINHAYVTNIGRLVGVVALKELRKAIEDSNAGIMPGGLQQTIPDSQGANVPLVNNSPSEVKVNSA